MADLWPDDLADVGSLKVPSAILKEQADALAKKTRNILNGEVSASHDRYADIHQINWHFAVVAPTISYRYELFRITHGIELYPVLLETDDPTILQSLGVHNIPDEASLISILKSIFSSARTQRIVKSLIAQSVSHRPAPSTDDDDNIPF